MADRNRNPGHAAAARAAQLAGATYSLPRRGGRDKKTDFADVLKAKGVAGVVAELNEDAEEQPDIPGVARDGMLVGTDLAHADAFIKEHTDKIRFFRGMGWLFWDGTRWQKDAELRVRELAKDTARRIVARDLPLAEPGHQRELLRSAHRLQSDFGMSAMLRVASSDARIAPKKDGFDSNAWLFNCANGTLDLRSGDLRPHDRDDCITRLAPVNYDPGATCPVFKKFLRRILPDTATRLFVWRYLGYCLTGMTREQVLAIFWGTGSNGKTTLTEAIFDVLGDYALTTSMDTLTARRNQGGAPSGDLARLQGARYILASEGARGLELNDAVVKDLTGGDTITARELYKANVQFRLAGKLVIRTNHEPVVRGQDEGIWRRLLLIEFNVKIPDHERDQGLTDKLRAEYPGILAWLVRGTVRWNETKLRAPDSVMRATRKYRSRMDVLGQFLRDRTKKSKDASENASALYRSYKEWCEFNGQRVEAQNVFGALLRERGHVSKRWHGKRTYFGLKLRTS